MKRDTTIMTSNSAIPLKDEIVRSFKIGKTYQESEAVTSIDFDDSGEICLTSSSNDCLRMFDCINGK